MRIPSVLVCGLVACGGGDDPAKPDAVAPDAPPRSCTSFGAFQPMSTIARLDGKPVATSAVESDPWILREGDKLRMWFTTASRTPPHDVRIASAESSDISDGRLWRNVDDSVLPPTPGTFDGEGVETASVVRHAGEYKLFYTADEPPDGSIRYTIGLARSPDGVTWTKHASPVLAPQLPWEQPFCENDECLKKIGGTLEPSVIVEGDRLRMWYAALGVVGETPSYRIAHATSTDGITWTRTPDPVFSAGPAGTWDETLVSHTHVVADPGGGGYHLFYFGSSLADHQRCEDAEGCLITPGSIGHAFSTDGITWTRNPNNPVLRATGNFDAWSVGGPMVLIEDGEVRLWYFGTPGAHSLDLRMGYATARCD